MSTPNITSSDISSSNTSSSLGIVHVEIKLQIFLPSHLVEQNSLSSEMNLAFVIINLWIKGGKVRPLNPNFYSLGIL